MDGAAGIKLGMRREATGRPVRIVAAHLALAHQVDLPEGRGAGAAAVAAAGPTSHAGVAGQPNERVLPRAGSANESTDCGGGLRNS